MLLLNAMDDPIVPPQLHHIPHQFARMNGPQLFCAPSNIQTYGHCQG